MVSFSQFIAFKKPGDLNKNFQDKLTKCFNGNLNHDKTKKILAKLSTKLKEVEWIDRHRFLTFLTNCRQNSSKDNGKIQALGIKILLQGGLAGDEYRQVKSIRKKQKLGEHPELFLQMITRDIERFKYNIPNANFIDLLPKYYSAVGGLASKDKELIDRMLEHNPLEQVIQYKEEVLHLAAYVENKEREGCWLQSIISYQTAQSRAFTDEDYFGFKSFHQEVQKGIILHLTNFGVSSNLARQQKQQLIEDLFYFYTSAPFHNKADELFGVINKNQSELGWQSIFAILHLMRELSEDFASHQMMGVSNDAREVAKVLDKMACLPKEDRCNIIDLAKKWFPQLLMGYACINIQKTFDILCLAWLLRSGDDRNNAFTSTQYLFSSPRNIEVEIILKQMHSEIATLLAEDVKMTTLDQMRPFFKADSQTAMIMKILDMLLIAQRKSFYEVNEVVQLTRSLLEDIPKTSIPSAKELYNMLRLVNELTPLQRQALIWHVIGVFWRFPTAAERIQLLQVFRSGGISALKKIEAEFV